jgi:hypothetical protein
MKVKYEVTVPNGQYFAIGYGWSMTDCDMVWWSANSSQSTQEDLWSTSHDKPVVKTNNYHTTFTLDPSNTIVHFTSYRDLDPRQAKSYVIELDKQIELCFAYSLTSSELVNHKDNYGVFSMQLNSSGSSTLKLARTDAWTLHAWCLWAAWTVIGLLQIITNRYMVHWIKSHQVLHTLFGLTSLGLTLYGGWTAFQARR